MLMRNIPVVTIMVDIMSIVDIMRWYRCLHQSFLLIRDFNMQNVDAMNPYDQCFQIRH